MPNIKGLDFASEMPSESLEGHQNQFSLAFRGLMRFQILSPEIVLLVRQRELRYSGASGLSGCPYRRVSLRKYFLLL